MCYIILVVPMWFTIEVRKTNLNRNLLIQIVKVRDEKYVKFSVNTIRKTVNRLFLGRRRSKVSVR